MRVLIIGGTGSFSGRITESVVARGHQVALYNRGQRAASTSAHVPTILGERSALREHMADIATFSPEAVIDSICYTPDQAEDLTSLFPQVRRLVFISSVDAYGQEIGCSPVSEDRPPAPVTEYGRDKLACEHVLLSALGAAVTAFRPSHILGRGFQTTSLWGRTPFLVDRLRKHKAIPAIDGGRNLMTPVSAGDAAEWVARSLDNPAADGQVFNAVGSEIICQRDYYECIARALSVPLQLVAIPSYLFRRHFESPPQFNWHRPYSCQKAVSLLGYRPQYTVETMIRETVDYMLANNLVRDCAEDPFDDRLVELLLRHEAELDALLAEKTS